MRHIDNPSLSLYWACSGCKKYGIQNSGRKRDARRMFRKTPGFVSNLLRFEEQDGAVAEVEIDEVLRL
jgi:hypothetical protein